MEFLILYSQNLIPAISFMFVGVLIICKIYIKIRSKFSIKVNCWFCNQYTKVPFKDYNSFNCPYCGQYNGFNSDGDYNKEIPTQYYENNTINYCKPIETSTTATTAANYNHFQLNETPKNGLCDTCNESQRIKVEKLSQFEPDSEDTFDYELNIYRDNLENLYRLCVQCEKHVEKTLREKKKIILGAKLNHFMKNKSSSRKSNNILSSEQLRNHHYKNYSSFLKNFNLAILLIFALMNFSKTLNEFNELNHTKFNSNNFIWYIIGLIVYHISSMMNYFNIYINQFIQIPIVFKLILYIRTISTLIYYTIGLRLNRTFNFVSYFMNTLPYFGTTLAFMNNLDGFKINKFTFLLTTWSLSTVISSYTTKSILFDGNTLLSVCKIILSTVTLILSIPLSRNSTKYLLSQKKNTFHRIYSENYMINNENYYNNLDATTSDLSRSTSSNNSSKCFSSNTIAKNHSNLSSDQHSIKSFADSLNSTIKPSLSSPSSFSVHNLSPTSAFKNYSKLNQNILDCNYNNQSNSTFLSPNKKFSSFHKSNNLNSDRFSVYSMPTSSRSRNLNLFNNTSNNNKQSMMNLSKSNSEYNSCYTSRSFMNNSFISNSSMSNNGRRLNLLSPSRLSCEKSLEYTLAPSQVSWISGGLFNNPTTTNSLRNRSLLNIATNSIDINSRNSSKENRSRGSSQSSGFESQSSLSTTATLNSNFENRINSNINNENISRENSYFDIGTKNDDVNGGAVNGVGAISPLPSSVSEFSFPLLPQSPLQAIPSFQHHQQQQIELPILDLSNQKNQNTANGNFSKDLSTRFLSNCRPELIGENNLNNYLKQQRPQPICTAAINGHNDRIDPFDLNIMNKDLSSIEEDDSIWRKQQTL